MNLINSLSPLQWAVILAVPPAIISLYFLKLKRQPVEVPSTYLWSRTVEDLHVNSIWQRLRQSLLLLLQILVVTLAILACLRPGWRGTELVGERFIFLIDNSASMNSTDLSPTRLNVAKERVLALVEQMQSGDVAMVISFSDTSRIEQAFTGIRSQLRQKVKRIRASQRRSDLGEALRAAAGLANPGRTSEANSNDVQVADALPATLYIFTDGGFTAVPNFSLGNLEPVYLALGKQQPDNLGIVSFSSDRNPEKPGQTQAFARLENCGATDANVDVTLYLDGELLEAANVTVPSLEEDRPGAAAVQFEFEDPGEGVLKLELQRPDSLSLDNTAYSVISTPRRANVLVVSPGNDALKVALGTDEAIKTAEVKFQQPDFLETREYQDAALAGIYDLVIYDQCVPERMPEANTLLFGNIPPVEGWEAGERTPAPAFIDTDPSHPLTQLVQMGDVKWNYDGFSIKGPPGSTTLMDADIGPILVVGDRGGFQDVALGLEIIGEDEQGNVGPKTEWPIRRSFPVFMMNVLRYLGGARAAYSTDSVRPGETTVVRTILPVETVEIETPSGNTRTVTRGGQNAFPFSQTDELGVYKVREGRGREVSRRFAVNLFDSRESNLRPRPAIELGYEKVAGVAASEPARKESWKWLLLLALGVLIFEWYVYNRRVYL